MSTVGIWNNARKLIWIPIFNSCDILPHKFPFHFPIYFFGFPVQIGCIVFVASKVWGQKSTCDSSLGCSTPQFVKMLKFGKIHFVIKKVLQLLRLLKNYCWEFFIDSCTSFADISVVTFNWSACFFQQSVIYRNTIDLMRKLMEWKMCSYHSKDPIL